MLKFNDYLKEAALSAKQKKIAAVAGDKDKIDAADLAALRNGKKPVEEASCDGKYMKKEELVGKQHKLDKNHNGKLDAQDFKMLRKEDKDTHSLDHEMEKHGDTFGHHHDSYDHDNSDVDRYYVKKQKQHVNAAEEALKKGDKKTMHAHLTHFYHLAGEAHDYAGRDEESAEASDLKHHHKKLAGKVHVKEGVEQIDELSKKTMGSYALKAMKDSDSRKQDFSDHDEDEPYEYGDGSETEKGTDTRKIHNRDTGVKRVIKKLTKEEIELDEGRMKDLAYDLDNMSHDEFHKQYGKPKSHYDPTNFKKPVEPGKGMDRARALAQRGMQSLSKEEVERIEEKLTQLDELSKGTLASYVKRSANQAIVKSLANPKDDSDDMKTIAKREKGINLATSKLAKEEVEQEMSPYLKGTLKVMDEGKIDNLRDAQKLRQDTQSAYEKDYKPDTSHPHIQVVKGSAYGGANQKDDEGDEKPDDESKEKRGRGRPAGSKSGARQKGGGHEDGGIPVHNLNLPKSYK